MLTEAPNSIIGLILKCISQSVIYYENFVVSVEAPIRFVHFEHWAQNEYDPRINKKYALKNKSETL